MGQVHDGYALRIKRIGPQSNLKPVWIPVMVRVGIEWIRADQSFYFIGETISVGIDSTPEDLLQCGRVEGQPAP